MNNFRQCMFEATATGSSNQGGWSGQTGSYRSGGVIQYNQHSNTVKRRSQPLEEAALKCWKKKCFANDLVTENHLSLLSDNLNVVLLSVLWAYIHLNCSNITEPTAPVDDLILTRSSKWICGKWCTATRESELVPLTNACSPHCSPNLILMYLRKLDCYTPDSDRAAFRQEFEQSALRCGHNTLELIISGEFNPPTHVYVYVEHKLSTSRLQMSHFRAPFLYLPLTPAIKLKTFSQTQA